MMGKKPVIGFVAAIAAVYVAYPYFTLYRLGHAIRSGDAVALETLIDWPAVREGIKEDICDFVIDQPPAVKAGKELPAFGSSFVRGIATNVIDTRVTPQALAAAATASDGATEATASPAPVRGASVSVSWAFFNSPTQFVVDLQTPGKMPPIRLQMDLRDGGWSVTRVWLPPQMLSQTNERT